jgi:hypothetical protein
MMMTIKKAEERRTQHEDGLVLVVADAVLQRLLQPVFECVRAVNQAETDFPVNL